MMGRHLHRDWRRTAWRALTTLSVALTYWVTPSATPLVAQRSASGDAPSSAATSAFPHARHARLFPQCAGCHAGISTGERARVYPDTARCTSCHNGRDRARVTWRGPTRAPSTLRFEHVAHAGATGSDGASCATCHANTGSGAPPAWMQVDRAKPTACLGCHTHRASSHLASEARCSTCHLSLAEAPSLSAARIGAFPRPPSHDTANFASAHAASAAAAPAQCAMCHARETCATCHVDASAIASRFGLVADARVASIVRGRTARYVTPASHDARDFAERHGTAANAPTATCATCHTRSSCAQCHTGTLGARALARLQEAEPGGAPGVMLRHVGTAPPMGVHAVLTDTVRQPRARTVQVHANGFARTHGVQAATRRPSCEGCHAQPFCTQCHAPSSPRRFHPANMVARHAPEAFARESECQQCHSRELFCRSCHAQVGLSARGRTAGGYHNGTSLWIIQHGQAARQTLPTCTTCHQQRDCMQCHSRAGRNINPHGPGFDAERAWKANRLVCLRCHFKDPLGR